MTTKHTPGPWNLRPATARLAKGNYFIRAGEREYIALVDALEGEEKNSANARLIVAAPELLAALENAANVLAALATGQLEKIERESPALMQCRAAITKAKGQS